NRHPRGGARTPPQASAPAPDEKTEAEPSPHFSTGLKAQLDARRQYAQPDPLDVYIGHHFPGALPNERQWLRANTHHLQNPALVHMAASIAAQGGCPRGSPEFLQFCGALLDQHHAAMQAHGAPPPEPVPTHAAPMPEPMPEPPPPSMPQPPPAPMAHIDLETEHGDSGEGDEHAIAAHFVAAPVSRGEHGYSMSGEHEPSAGRITLTRAQREHAEAAGVSEEECSF